MNRVLLLISICVATGILNSCSSKEQERHDVEKFSVTTPLLTDTSFTKEYVAEIQSVQNVEIRAKVKGFVEKINVDEGQSVKAGQLLFTIRPVEYQAELSKARAEVKKAELEKQNAKILADKNIVSQTEYALASAKLDQAKAEEAVANLYVSYTQIRAPFAGIIDRIPFKVGSLIDEGTLLTSLSNNREVYAYFNVSESEYLDFKDRQNSSGNEVTLLLANGLPHKYKGSIQTIEGQFDKNTGSIPFRAKFPNPDLLLKHGETGRVQRTVALSNALIIPQAATFEIQDKVYVYVVDKNNVVSARNISVKQRLPNIYVIDDGLSANDKILLEGIQSVKDDQKIQAVYIPVRQVLLQMPTKP